MDAPAPVPRGAPAASEQSEQSQATIFRKYYTDNDYFMSPEGILKILSAVFALNRERYRNNMVGLQLECPRLQLVCVVTSAVFLGAGSCAGAGEAALACGVVAALLYAGVVLDAPLYAPQAWLFTDIVLSTVMGVLLLVTAVLSITLCDKNSLLDYIYGPMEFLTACMVTASAVLTYASVMRLADAARAQPGPPPQPTPPEQDV